MYYTHKKHTDEYGNSTYLRSGRMQKRLESAINYLLNTGQDGFIQDDHRETVACVQNKKVLTKDTLLNI